MKKYVQCASNWVLEIFEVLGAPKCHQILPFIFVYDQFAFLAYWGWLKYEKEGKKYEKEGKKYEKEAKKRIHHLIKVKSRILGLTLLY